MPKDDVLPESDFQWTKEREDAAILLAQGYLIKEVAATLKISERTITRWKSDVIFSKELDRLSLMLDIAGKAERMRIAIRMVRKALKKKNPTRKDLLEWLKYAQSESEGTKLNLTGDLAGFIAAAIPKDGSPVAGSGPTGTDEKRPSGDDQS